ncbi:MAG: SUMF1/EgtB/PvdO family nonheme iron enzyme [Alphaproteobacteria bacterium]|nr:SUMF1/EgtB/PvdO family nonheme iron enzyme [Alphaproteobacteria bacterium]
MTHDDPEAPDPDDPFSTGRPRLPERYRYVGLIGMGGMGEVHRVRDTVLERTVAMKILRDELAGYAAIAIRFEDEAIATAQLEHPGIVPVYDFGALPDGRRFFTMQEIKGDTLTALAFPVHVKTNRQRRWERSEAGWTLTRLLDAFRQCCQAVAHAHARGVLHRDLKPDNLMIGSLGEVLVVDWGLAKVGAGPETPLENVTLRRTSNDSMRTKVGTIAGTPAYMAPEQAFGKVDELAPPSDVYALGSILYFLLAGQPPYEGDAKTALRAVRKGPPTPLIPLAPVSEELILICRKAMAREPGDRYPDAGALADALIAYEDGAERRKKALALVSEAQDELPLLWQLRERGRLEAQRARQLGAEAKSWQPIAEKQALWTAEDRAEALQTDAELTELRTVQLLRGALTHEPEMPEAHAVLADLYRQRHEDAERVGNASAARRYALLLAEHDRTGIHASYLRGDGDLTLHTEVPAEVTCFRFVEEGRRLVPVLDRELGETPLVRVPLERGSYLLRIEAPGRHPVDYPVRIDRLTHWDGVPPGSDGAHAVRLPRAGDIGEGEIYVPAGWTWTGGDTLNPLSGPLEHKWIDGFVIARDPVTNREYLAFLNDLVATGRARDAKRWVPRHRGESGAPIYGRDAEGAFCLVPDSDGDVWELDWPVLLVSFDAAQAYAAWRAEQTGLPWRLPWEDEWEKAARGVDRRRLPWGDYAEPTWAAVRDGREGRPLPSSVDAHPVDCSPYGVRGMAGNVADWCLDERQPGIRAYRGGAWSFPVGFCSASMRRAMAGASRGETVGVRIARTLPPRGD